MMQSLSNVNFFQDGHFVFRNQFFFKGKAPSVSDSVFVIPGLVDVHVHLREPGFSYKATVKTGTAAAAAGGYPAVCCMANRAPVPDTYEHLKVQLDIIEKDAAIQVRPFGSITRGELGETLSDMEAMAPYVAGFSDDGKGVQSEKMMLEAMKLAKSLGKVISAHCEDNSLLHGGYIHAGRYAARHGHKGISAESEWGPIARDLDLAAKTGCAYHVCHVSTAKSVDLIRQAKKSGVDVTCETGPHYLLLCDEDLQEDGRFKMNPPLRSPEDRDALVEGLQDGTVDMVATDHAPHSAEEKSRGLAGSLMGVVGLECAFPVLYTGLVETGKLSLETLVERMSLAPARRFGIDNQDCYAIFDLNAQEIIDPERFQSMGRATPFAGWSVHAAHVGTIYRGELLEKGRNA